MRMRQLEPSTAQGNCIMEFCSKKHLKVVTVCHCEPPLLFFGGEAIPHFVKINSILEQSLLLTWFGDCFNAFAKPTAFRNDTLLWNKRHFPGQKRIVRHKNAIALERPGSRADLCLGQLLKLKNILEMRTFFSYPRRIKAGANRLAEYIQVIKKTGTQLYFFV